MSAIHTVILFHTTNHAFRAEKILREADIDCRMVPVPRHLSSDCGMCARISSADADGAREALSGSKVEVAGVPEV